MDTWLKIEASEVDGFAADYYELFKAKADLSDARYIIWNSDKDVQDAFWASFAKLAGVVTR